MIDWLAREWQSVATTIVAAIGAYVALAGLHTWRAQLRGKTEYELARRVLRAVLEVRDQITSVRAPFISLGEINAAFKEAGIEPHDGDVTRDDRGNYLVYDRRWKGLSKALSDLRVESLEAEVLWGPGIRQPEASLFACVNELQSAVQHHLEARRSPLYDSELPKEMRAQFRKVLYLGGVEPGKDAFNDRVAGIVAQFETLLRPHLRLTR